MTKWELFKALGAEHPLPRHFTDASGSRHYGYLRSIEREDGSGHSFNVTINPEEIDRGFSPKTFHVRTSD
jgi:hypothetical protein